MPVDWVGGASTDVKPEGMQTQCSYIACHVLKMKLHQRDDQADTKVYSPGEESVQCVFRLGQYWVDSYMVLDTQRWCFLH